MLGAAAVVLVLAPLGGSAASATGAHDVDRSDRVLQRATYLAERARLGLTSAPYALPCAGGGLPSVGSPRVFALLISFSDYPPAATSTQVASRLFGDGIATDYPYDSLRNGYRRSSYGKLDIQGSVLGWYDAGQTRSSVTDMSELVLRALQYYDPTTDFRQFDNNGDGRIDYFLVLWTGPNAGSWSPWATAYWLENPPSLGLPDVADVYPNDAPKGGAGRLDQMDGYGDLGGFFKWVLGWMTPQVSSGGPVRYALAPSGTSPDALVVMPGGGTSKPFTELFLVQNRSAT